MSTYSRQQLIEICQLVYDRYLTNAAGSNLSVRASKDTFYITPTNNAKNNRLRMGADDLLLVDYKGCILDGKGDLSRSWPTHLKMYQEFEFVNAVIHAHPKMATIFSCRKKEMPPFLDAMKKYGPIPVLPRDLTVDSLEFGQAIADIFKNNGTNFLKNGHAVFYPFHGVLVAAPTLEDAYDLLERIEFNATAILYSRFLENDSEG
jgi:L-fuculose-phosphate aldolase